jgi:hypothetical protein
MDIGKQEGYTVSERKEDTIDYNVRLQDYLINYSEGGKKEDSANYKVLTHG